MRIRELASCCAALLFVLPILALALPAVAEDGETAAPPQSPTATEGSAADTAQPVPAEGMVAFIDPETGRLTSTPTEAQRAAMQAALAAALDRSQEGLYDVVMPDGSVIRDLQGRFQHAAVVWVAPDGTLKHGCTTNAEAATAAPAPPTTEQPAAAVTE